MSSKITGLAELAWTQLWQVTIVAALVLLIVRLLCRKRPHMAHALLLIVLVKCLTPPILMSSSSVFGHLLDSVGESNTTTRIDRDSGKDGAREEIANVATQSVNQQTVDQRPTTLIIADEKSTFLSSGALQTNLLYVWGLGAAVLGLCAAVIWLRYLKAIRRTSEPAYGLLGEEHQRLSQALCVRRFVGLFVSSESYGPCCFGALFPRVVVPNKLFEHVPNDTMKLLLAHELVHVRRGDNVIALFQALAGILWWFHPLVWCMSKELSREREKCCDEEVLAGTKCAPEDYAQGMLSVLKMKRALHNPILVIGIRPFDVTKERLERIMNRNTKLHSRTPWFCWVILAVGITLFIPGGHQVAISAGDSATPNTATKNTDERQSIDASTAIERGNVNKDIAVKVLRAGGKVTVRIANGRKVDVDLLAYLPVEPFELVGITLGDFGGVVHESPLQTPIDGSILDDLKRAGTIESLQLRLVNVTDLRVKNLVGLTKMSRLILSRANLYGDGLINLAELGRLEELSLERNQISDDSLKHLSTLKRLRWLTLFGCPVTDDSIQYLGQLNTLKFIDLRETRLSSLGIDKLRKQLPDCEIRTR